MACLEQLWTKESGWNHKAQNTCSGAYGIPQALPGQKMAAYGADWQTNPVPQIRWGLDYIKNRYGTPVRRLGILAVRTTGTDRPVLRLPPVSCAPPAARGRTRRITVDWRPVAAIAGTNRVRISVA